MRKRPTKEQFDQQVMKFIGELRQEMIAGIHALDEYLPSEKSLEQRFKLSNHSIRKGLEQLVEEGWIEKIPSVGNRVITRRPPVKLSLACNVITLRNLAFEKLLEDFHQLYPWITVEPVIGQRIPGVNEQHGTIETDAIIIDNFQFQQLLEKNLVSHLETCQPVKDIYRRLYPLFSTNQELYMMPVVLSPLVLCYNKQHFAEKGLAEPDGSWTWEDLIHYAEVLSDDKGRYGFGFHLQSHYRWPLFLMQSGECFRWDDARLEDMRNSKLLDSVKLCKDILHNRKAIPLYLSENNDDIDQMFFEGKLSMTLNTYMGLNGWNHMDLDYGISPVPYIDELRTLVISLGVGISKETAHQEETRLFAQYLTSERAQSIIFKHTMSVPALSMRSLSLKDKEIFAPERYYLFRETLGSFRTHADLNISASDFTKLASLLKPYWANMIDEEELCKRIETMLSRETWEKN